MQILQLYKGVQEETVVRLDNIPEKERRKTIVNDLNKNMFVEAGAGAGKTTIIVKRIINQLMAGIKPEEIVAITFTNAATRELKGRIYAEALSVASGAAGPEDEVISKDQLSNIRVALDELDQMQISTIHSFCYRILSEKMFDASLPYDFAPEEENRMEEIRRRYFNKWAETLNKQDWERLLPAGKYKSSVIDRLYELTSRLDSVPGDYEIRIAMPDISEEEARKRLDPIVARICSEALLLVNDAYGTCYASFDQVGDGDLTNYGRRLRDTIAGNEIVPICKILLSPPSTSGFILKAVTKESMNVIGITDAAAQKIFKASMSDRDGRIREYIRSVWNDIECIKAGYLNTLFGPYVEYAKEALDHVQTQTDAAVISNNGLLEKTRELIRSSDDVRRFFGNKFRIIYVDEFQDTDHTQESFIRLLASDPADPDRLRDGALFVVGDPKQSIYRFRGAEPEVYFSVKRRMEDQDNTYVVELADNYRSNERIIDWVNDRFAHKNITIGQNYIPMNTGYPLPGNGLPEKLFAGVYRYRSPENALDPDNITDDMDAVCRLILSLTENGYLIADRDDDDKVIFRKIKYSDFLILCMNTPGMSGYADYFHSYGIPLIMDSKSDLRYDHDLHSFVRMYAYLADPADEAARAGALEALEVSGASDRQRNENVLSLMVSETDGMSAYGCMQYLMNNPALYMYKGIPIKEYQITDMQRKIIQMTEQIEAEAFGNRQTMLNAMYAYMEEKSEHELLLKRDTNAVRFMNLHKAKGLEGNIVIWTNRTENRSFKEGEYRNGQTFYPSIGYRSKGYRNTEWSAYGGDKVLISQAQAEDESETIRLEYVAATRAKQALVFMDRYNNKPGNMFCGGYDLISLDTVEDIVSAYECPEDASDDTKVLKLKDREERGKEDELSGQLKRIVYSSESPSDYEDDSAGRTDRTAEGPDKTAGKEKRSSELIPRPTGNIFGTVMHRAFELIVNRRDADPGILGIGPEELVMSCVRQAVNESIQDINDEETPVYEEFLREAVFAFGRWFWKSDLKRDADRIYTELPFSYMKRKDDKDVPPVWMHGEADLVIRLKDGGYYIIDYKSDSDEAYPDEAAFTERLKGKYSPQIIAYKEAVGYVFGADADTIRAALISFSQKDLGPGEKLRLRITPINNT